jgi:predicted kinase
MPVCFQLVGVPGSGKSTWAKSLAKSPDTVIISSDHYVEQHAAANGKTYNEVFEEFMPSAVRIMMEAVTAASKAGKHIIWDQTSTTIASRRRKFNALPHYTHIAVVFETPSLPELSARLKSRPGKVIPSDVVRGMIEMFDLPTTEEGFSAVLVRS